MSAKRAIWDSCLICHSLFITTIFGVQKLKKIKLLSLAVMFIRLMVCSIDIVYLTKTNNEEAISK